VRRARSLFLLSLVGLIGCTGTVDKPGPCDLTFDLLRFLRIDSVRHPTPVLPGSALHVRGESFLAETSCVRPQVALVGVTEDGAEQEILLDETVSSPNHLTAVVPRNAITALGGLGTFDGELLVRFQAVVGSARFEVRHDLVLVLAHELEPRITNVEQTEAYLNDLIHIDGSGFLLGDEGTTSVVLAGTFTRRLEDGTEEDVEVRDIWIGTVPVFEGDRTTVAFPWSPRIGGILPGSFVGSLTPWNAHAGGDSLTAFGLALEMEQMGTVLFGVDPPLVRLGQIVDVTGRGFIGSPAIAPDEAEGTTSFRLEGVFEPYRGIPPRCNIPPYDVENEVVGTWSGGQLVRYAVTASGSSGELLAVDFGAPRGDFFGSVTPVLTLGSERVFGHGIDGIELTLGPIRQVCWVRFLTGFSDSLDLFGLGAVEEEIKRRVIRRMQEIYQPPDRHENHVNIVFVTEEPNNYYPAGYAILDIGGHDPNDRGFFGYDNTPDKDCFNLRLNDHIGGENALGDIDGHAYGGVFIESMLFWSEHPPFEERPPNSPSADPRFDIIFDTLRDNEVVAGEYPHGSDGIRLAQIEAGIWFLSNMIADTAAHEFGHSLGLANPYDPDGRFHNQPSGEGCLMDAGGDRPLEERALLDGNEGARFCTEALWYLLDILPMN